MCSVWNTTSITPSIGNVFNERQHIEYPVGNIGSKNNYHILSHLINTLFFFCCFCCYSCLWRFIAYRMWNSIKYSIRTENQAGETLAFNYNQVLHHITLWDDTDAKKFLVNSSEREEKATKLCVYVALQSLWLMQHFRIERAFDDQIFFSLNFLSFVFNS